jgi:hypothetical protein
MRRSTTRRKSRASNAFSCYGSVLKREARRAQLTATSAASPLESPLHRDTSGHHHVRCRCIPGSQGPQVDAQRAVEGNLSTFS